MPANLYAQPKSYGRPKQFTITPRRGDPLFATVWELRVGKPGRRRIQVHTEDGRELFDTGDCVDYSNAMNGLDNWLTARGVVLAGDDEDDDDLPDTDVVETGNPVGTTRTQR